MSLGELRQWVESAKAAGLKPLRVCVTDEEFASLSPNLENGMWFVSEGLKTQVLPESQAFPRALGKAKTPGETQA